MPVHRLLPPPARYKSCRHARRYHVDAAAVPSMHMLCSHERRQAACQPFSALLRPYRAFFSFLQEAAPFRGDGRWCAGAISIAAMARPERYFAAPRQVRVRTRCCAKIGVFFFFSSYLLLTVRGRGAPLFLLFFFFFSFRDATLYICCYYFPPTYQFHSFDYMLYTRRWLYAMPQLMLLALPLSAMLCYEAAATPCCDMLFAGASRAGDATVRHVCAPILRI